MQKPFLETGKITGTHGLKGEVRVQPWADSPEFLSGFETLYLDNGARRLTVTSARVHKQMVIMKFSGVDTVEQAEQLRNRILYMDRSDVELEEGAYFIQDLLGLTVVDDYTGEALGVLADVSETGANDVYHIRMQDGRTVLIPVIPDVVRDISPEKGQIRVFRMKGLFEE